MKHSETPWEQKGLYIFSTKSPNCVAIIENNNLADAELIVHAVNTGPYVINNLRVIANTVAPKKDWSHYTREMLLEVIHSMAEYANDAITKLEKR